MEEHFLKDFVDGEPEFKAEPWYNPDGDCIHYQAVDEAVYADRIDSLLTLYRSANDDRVIGFQVKGVMAILEEFKLRAVAISANQETDRSISVIEILLVALKAGEGQPTAEQFAGLSSLLRGLRHDRIPLPTAA